MGQSLFKKLRQSRNFTALYGTRRFIIALTRTATALHRESHKSNPYLQLCFFMTEFNIILLATLGPLRYIPNNVW
jgi:hypothetical protein